MTDNCCVRWLSGLAENQVEICGQKVAQLSRLMAAGFPVPDGFCVTTRVYREHVLRSGLLVSGAHTARGRPFVPTYSSILEVTLDSIFVTELINSYHRLQDQSPGPVAVRSSAVVEDLSGYSFAGLYDTILNVSDESALMDAIRRCWASYWNKEAILYREQAGLEHTQYEMAVLVQTLVQSELAGVLFTQAPLHNNTLIIELVQGSAELLVSGAVRAKRFLVDRDTRQLLYPSHTEARTASFLLNQLIDLGLAIEQHQGVPQDIEWCVDVANRIWILQTRPITSITNAQALPQVDSTTGWQRAYDEPFSPLGYDLTMQRHRYWVDAINVYHKTAFKPEIGAINGFLYYKSPWRDPGTLIRLWIGFWRLVRWLQARRIYQQYVETVLPAHSRRLKELEQQNIADLDEAALLEGFNASVQAYLDFQHTSYAIVAIAITSVGFLDRLCQLWFRKDGNMRAADFLSGLDNLSIARDLTLHRLGQMLGEILGPDEIAGVDCAGLWALNDGELGQRFCSELQAFLDTYGYVWADRYPRDPAWKLNEEALVASLSHIAQTPTSAGLVYGHKRQAQRRAQNVEKAAQQLSAHARFSLRWAIFSWLLRQAERLFPCKEDRNHLVYQAVMVIRKYAQEIGRRLNTRGVLRSEEEVFFLMWEEIQSTLSSGGTAAELRHQVEARKQTYYQSKQQGLTRIPHMGLEAAHRRSDGDTLTIALAGEPCSPGVAVGTVCLISGPSELHRVQPGDIVVCSHLRPAWSTVFIRAIGVVIETGSLLSHGATLAREYSVPAVMNIADVTKIVHEGDRLTVDGHLGTVLIERAGSHARS